MSKEQKFQVELLATFALCGVNRDEFTTCSTKEFQKDLHDVDLTFMNIGHKRTEKQVLYAKGGRFLSSTGFFASVTIS
jgi:hypothetical protein